MNTGKEGKARQYMKSSSYTKATEPCQQAGPRDSSQLPCGEGKVQGQAACRLEVHPPEGSHTCLASSSCQTRVPLLLLSCSCFPQRGCPCFVTAEMNSPCGGVPCKMRGSEEALQGHRPQAHALLTSAGS